MREAASAELGALTVQTTSASVLVRSSASKCTPTNPVAPVSMTRSGVPTGRGGPPPGRMSGSRTASASRAAGRPGPQAAAGLRPEPCCSCCSCCSRNLASSAGVGCWKSQATFTSRRSSTPRRLATWMTWSDWAPRSKTSSRAETAATASTCCQTAAIARSSMLSCAAVPTPGSGTCASGSGMCTSGAIAASAFLSIFPALVRGRRSRNSTADGIIAAGSAARR